MLSIMSRNTLTTFSSAVVSSHRDYHKQMHINIGPFVQWFHVAILKHKIDVKSNFIRLTSWSASHKFDLWLGLYFVYTTGRTPDNVGQVLKDLLFDSNVDIAKFVSCKHKIQNETTDNFENIEKYTQFPLSGRKTSGNYAIFYFHQSTEFGMLLA